MDSAGEEEVIISCAKCGTTPDDVLILTCDHNLCLICAAKNLRREQAKTKHSFQTVICDICGSPTVLDPTSASELLAMAPESSPRPRENIEETVPYTYNINNKYLPSRAGNRIQMQEHPPKQEIPRSKYSPEDRTGKGDAGICAHHPDEEIKYFCFSCMGLPVCAECVVHGIHNGHDVMNVKKAYPTIKAKLDENIMHIHGKVDELQVHNDSIHLRKKELVEQRNSINNQTVNLFEELKKRINMKEQELLDVNENQLQNHLRELETYEKVINGKMESFISNSEYLKTNIHSLNNLELLEFYGENYEGIGQMLEDNIGKMGSLHDIQHAKLFVDIPSLNEFKLNINQLTDHVSSLNGIQLQSYSSNP